MMDALAQFCGTLIRVEPRMSTKVLTCEDFSALVGKTINAYFYPDGYWRMFVALRAATSETFVFSTVPHGLAKYFEVFALKSTVEDAEERSWVSVSMESFHANHAGRR
jgi:hypothetical protein